MKKSLKVIQTISALSLLVLPLSGCKVTQKKVNAGSEAVKETSLYYNGDTETDFKVEYRYNYNKGKVSDSYVATVSKDVDKQTYYLTYNSDTTTENLKVYVENGSAYVESIGANGSTTKTKTEFSSPRYYLESTSYNDYSNVIYETYKNAPYLGCNSLELDEFKNLSKNEKEIAKRDIRKGLPGINTYSMQLLTCKADKRLFGKDITYKLHYALNDLASFRDVEVKANKNNRIVSVKITDSIKVGNDDDYTKVVEVNFSYDDVK